MARLAGIVHPRGISRVSVNPKSKFRRGGFRDLRLVIDDNVCAKPALTPSIQPDADEIARNATKERSLKL